MWRRGPLFSGLDVSRVTALAPPDQSVAFLRRVRAVVKSRLIAKGIVTGEDAAISSVILEIRAGTGGEEAAQQIYITFAQGRVYLVTAQAPREELNGLAVDRLRILVAETKIEVPGLNVGITGEPVLEKDEMEQSQKDTTIASIVSLVLCALIFVYGYQETGRPLKATLCLIVGLGYTMCFATLVIGHLNILTITFVPMLIGLAIDFGVHLITRYEEEPHDMFPAARVTDMIVSTATMGAPTPMPMRHPSYWP